MALVTLGTTANNSLTSSPAFTASMNQSDAGSLSNLIKDDQNPAHPLWPGAFETCGILYIPRRGILQVLPGDFIGVDSQGWPVLISKNSIANAAWTHT